MAAHTLLGPRGSTTAKQTADLGVSRGGQFCDKYDVIQVKNGEAATALYFKAIHASNKGYVKMQAIPGDGSCVVIADGISVPDIYEFDIGNRAVGVVDIAIGNAADGDTVTLDDSVAVPNPSTFEFDSGVVGNDGRVTVASVADGDTVSFHGKIYEFDEGDHATGSIGFICQPADGQTITVGDGTNPPLIYEFDDSGVRAQGTITLAAGNAAANDIITVDDGTHAAIAFECNGAGAYAFALGASNLATLVNLAAQITAAHTAGDLDFTVTNDLAGTLTLTFDDYGVAGNSPNTDITETVDAGGTWSRVQPAGGVDSTVVGTNIPVVIQASFELTATELYNNMVVQKALTVFDITVVDNGVGGLTLTNDNPGVAGNVAIITTSHAIVESGMAGGTAAGSGVITPGNIAVAIGATDTDSAHNLTQAFIANDATLPGSTHALGVVTMASIVPVSAYNGVVTENTGGTRLVTVDCTNGATPGTNIVAGNIGVALGADAQTSCNNLMAAVNGVGAGLKITATAVVPMGGGTFRVGLRHDDYAVDGNTAITVAGANLSKTDFTGGEDPGSTIGAGHIGVARALTAAGCLTNLAAAITGSGSAVVTSGTQYTEVDSSGTTWYVLPLVGDHDYDTFVVDQDTTSLAAGNMVVSSDDAEYKQEGIGVFQMDGTYYTSGAGWLEIPYGTIQERPARTVQLTKTADSTLPVPASTATYLGIGRNELVPQGNISARIIVVPRLATASTTHGAFAATGDVITVYGVVKNR